MAQMSEPSVVLDERMKFEEMMEFACEETEARHRVSVSGFVLQRKGGLREPSIVLDESEIRSHNRICIWRQNLQAKVWKYIGNRHSVFGNGFWACAAEKERGLSRVIGSARREYEV